MRCRRQKDQDIASFACSRNTCDRSLHWHDRTTGEDLRARSIASGETWNTSGKPHGLLLDRTRQRSACTAFDSDARTKDNAWTGHDRSQCTIEQGPVMTGHNNARSSKDRSRKKAVMAAIWSFLLDRLDVERSILRFPSLLHGWEGALRILAKGNWKSNVFWWGGRFGRSLLCPGRAEKKTRGSCPPTGCLPVDRNKLGPDSWRDEKGVWYRTDRQTDTHTNTRN